jgi:hypothetical protein
LTEKGPHVSFFGTRGQRHLKGQSYDHRSHTCNASVVQICNGA